MYDVIGLQDGDTSELDRLRAATGSVVIAVSYDGLRPDLEALALDRGRGRGDPAQHLRGAAGRGHQRGRRGAPRRHPDRSHPRRYPGKEVGLSPRESDVLALIVHGLCNQDIATECFLSVNSVKTYIRSTYRKIDVSQRAQAVVWAMQHGFAPPPPH